MARDFPVEWPHPGDANLVWTHDRLHYPDQITPLEFALIQDGVDAGLTKGALAYDIPFVVHDRLVNGYLYNAMAADPSRIGPKDTKDAISPALEAAMSNLGALWEGVWLPEIKEHLAALAASGPPTPSGQELLHRLEDTIGRWTRLWEIHFLLILPAKLAISEFVDLYADLFGDDVFAPLRMIAGSRSKTTECVTELWALSARAGQSPAAVDIVRSLPADGVLAGLDGHPEGTDLAREIRGFLERFGARADKLSLSYPSWIEDPTPVVNALRQYLVAGDRDPEQELQTSMLRRQEEVAALQARLGDLPRVVRSEVEARLRSAQEGAFLGEEHGHWIDYQASYLVRRFLLAIGEHLVAAGILGAQGDVFYLEMPEVRAALGDHGTDSGRPGDLAARAAERRARVAPFAAQVPPLVLGAVAGPEGAGEDQIDAVLEVYLHRTEGEPAASPSATTIFGLGCSPGVVEGTVKVVRTLYEGSKLAPGDVLVAATTTPPWTVLFASAGALVTDTGGILCHSAVVAREYGLPAVVGTGDATSRLRDGQRVVVDGSRGTVRIVE